MKQNRSAWLVTLTLALCWLSISVAARQEREFTHPEGRYAITLKEGWEEVISKDGAGNTVVDIIFENRERGLLRIRERRRDQDIAPQELAQRDQETSFRFRPGFVQGSIEPFNHKEYPGALLTFDFTYGGRPKTAFYYYLKIDANSYYTLQFEGHPQVLKTMRNRTDLMVRSFRVLR